MWAPGRIGCPLFNKVNQTSLFLQKGLIIAAPKNLETGNKDFFLLFGPHGAKPRVRARVLQDTAQQPPPRATEGARPRPTERGDEKTLKDRRSPLRTVGCCATGTVGSVDSNPKEGPGFALPCHPNLVKSIHWMPLLNETQDLGSRAGSSQSTRRLLLLKTRRRYQVHVRQVEAGRVHIAFKKLSSLFRVRLRGERISSSSIRVGVPFASWWITRITLVSFSNSSAVSSGISVMDARQLTRERLLEIRQGGNPGDFGLPVFEVPGIIHPSKQGGKACIQSFRKILWQRSTSGHLCRTKALQCLIKGPSPNNGNSAANSLARTIKRKRLILQIGLKTPKQGLHPRDETPIDLASSASNASRFEL